MKLPNPESAIVDDEKLSGYCLNPFHSDGRHKARVFQSALGLNQENSDDLRSALLGAVQTCEAIPDKRNRYGQKYIVDFLMTRLDKETMIRSIWIVRDDENFPRLVTCYIL
ncbi:MAG: DUF6883 domain-containing protein [Cyanobacteria bacterium P01_D01_bin.44]